VQSAVRRCGIVAVALIAGLPVLAGCGGSGDDGRTTSTAATATTGEPERPLPAAWYEDPDGDLVSTAVERRIGTDPDVDECAKDAGCGDVGGASMLERSNTLLILDSSGSMAGPAGGGMTKIAAAKQALRRYVAGAPDSLAIGFMVFGHKGSNSSAGKARSCAGIELLDPIGTAASRRFDRTLDRFRAVGYTPLAGALRAARAAFDGKEDGVNRIILVTDGVETCGGDPVAEARSLKRAGIAVTTDVVGFDVAKPAEAQRLRAIAEASGGTYSDARDGRALEEFFAAERERIEELGLQALCLVDKAAEVSSCQRDTAAKGLLSMVDARSEASNAGRDAEAVEIERLENELRVAREERSDEADARRAELARRLQTEIEEAERRLERLNP
jgi:Ca-activated chloride channel family protein